MFPLSDYDYYGPKVLDLYSARQRAIANNIANVNTPGYKTVEVPFPERLMAILDEQNESKEKLDLPPEPIPFMPPGGEARSIMERTFLQNSRMFDGRWSSMGEDSAEVDLPGPPKGPEVWAAINAVPLEPRQHRGGFMRLDGNNVVIDKQVIQMVHNAVLYKGLADDIGGHFKSMGSIIAGTY